MISHHTTHNNLRNFSAVSFTHCSSLSAEPQFLQDSKKGSRNAARRFPIQNQYFPLTKASITTLHFTRLGLGEMQSFTSIKKLFRGFKTLPMVIIPFRIPALLTKQRLQRFKWLRRLVRKHQQIRTEIQALSVLFFSFWFRPSSDSIQVLESGAIPVVETR